MVVLVICRCVNATDAKMETTPSVDEDGHEVDTNVGCKAGGKSKLFLLSHLARYCGSNLHVFIVGILA